MTDLTKFTQLVRSLKEIAPTMPVYAGPMFNLTGALGSLTTKLHELHAECNGCIPDGCTGKFYARLAQVLIALTEVAADLGLDMEVVVTCAIRLMMTYTSSEAKRDYYNDLACSIQHDCPL